MQSGYDHSYFFIATFIGDHLRHHVRAMGLKAGKTDRKSELKSLNQGEYPCAPLK